MAVIPKNHPVLQLLQYLQSRTTKNSGNSAVKRGSCKISIFKSDFSIFSLFRIFNDVPGAEREVHVPAAGSGTGRAPTTAVSVTVVGQVGKPTLRLKNSGVWYADAGSVGHAAGDLGALGSSKSCGREAQQPERFFVALAAVVFLKQPLEYRARGGHAREQCGA